jgi:hypothetical protein
LRGADDWYVPGVMPRRRNHRQRPTPLWRLPLSGIGGTLALSPLTMAPVVGYLSVLTGAAWWSVIRRRVNPLHAPAGASHELTRFVVVIPAHNEEQLIASTVRSLMAAHYPAELVDVHVVADHCTDRTAEVAAREGAQVHVHEDPEPAGKGPALQWMLDRLAAQRTGGADVAPDVIIFLDADSIVQQGFFTALHARFATGARVVQAYYAVRDVDASVAVGLRAAALALRHHLRPLGRTTLGGSCGLFGNGMAFRHDVLRDRSWSEHLTEDLEFQVELLLDDVRVDFAPDAVLEAEMPTTLDDSRTQNERWERGRLDLARRYLPRLLREAAAARGRRRVALLDTAADLAVPPLSVVVAAWAGTTLASVASHSIHPTRASRLGRRTAAMSTAGLAVFVLSGLRLAGAPRSVYRALAGAPAAVVWKVALWARMVRRPDDATWTRTARNAEGSPQQPQPVTSGQLRSLSDNDTPSVIGHSMPNAGSSQRTPRSQAAS